MQFFKIEGKIKLTPYRGCIGFFSVVMSFKVSGKHNIS